MRERMFMADAAARQSAAVLVRREVQHKPWRYRIGQFA